MSDKSGTASKIALAVGFGFFFGSVMVYGDLLDNTAQTIYKEAYSHLILNNSFLVGILVWAVISAFESGLSLGRKIIELGCIALAMILLHTIYSPLSFMLDDWRTSLVMNLLLWLVLNIIVWYFSKPNSSWDSGFTIHSERRYWWSFHRTTTVRRSRRP